MPHHTDASGTRTSAPVESECERHGEMDKGCEGRKEGTGRVADTGTESNAVSAPHPRP